MLRAGLAIKVSRCLAWFAGAGHMCAALAQGGALPAADPGFVTVLSANTALVGARLLATGLVDGRYTLVQVRRAEPDAMGTWRLVSEHTLSVDCSSAVRRVALLQGTLNRQPDPGAPPSWEQQPASVNAGGHQVRSRDLEHHAVVNPEPSAQQPAKRFDALRLPSAWHVAADWACLAATEPANLAGLAAEVQKTAGLPGLEMLHCHLTDKSGAAVKDLTMTYNEALQVVRLGDQWVSGGVLNAQYLAVSAGDVDVRLVRATGAMRLVSRAHMQSVGFGTCKLMPLPERPGQKKAVW